MKQNASVLQFVCTRDGQRAEFKNFWARRDLLGASCSGAAPHDEVSPVLHVVPEPSHLPQDFVLRAEQLRLWSSSCVWGHKAGLLCLQDLSRSEFLPQDPRGPLLTPALGFQGTLWETVLQPSGMLGGGVQQTTSLSSEVSG